jgi:hypothetical protein
VFPPVEPPDPEPLSGLNEPEPPGCEPPVEFGGFTQSIYQFSSSSSSPYGYT